MKKLPSLYVGMASQVRQNYHEECEAAVNKQIHGEFCAMYTYLAMAAHFNRDDTALKGIATFFKELAMEELEHAEKFMKLQNQRGGKVILKDIRQPKKDGWDSSLEAMEEALAVELKENHHILELHKLALKHGDAQLADFVQNSCLTESVEIIKKIGDHITNLKRVGPGHGEWNFSEEM